MATVNQLCFTVARPCTRCAERAPSLCTASQAIAEGFRDVWMLDHDPLLEQLRANPAFKQVAAGLRSTVAELRARAEREGGVGQAAV